VRAFPGLAGRDLVREVAPARSEAGFAGGGIWKGIDARSLAAPGTDPAGALGLADEFPFRGVREGVLAGTGKRVALLHAGRKEGIDASLRRRGALVRVLAPGATPEEVLAGDPHALLVSNGPGDPAALEHLIRLLQSLIGKLPIFGICLGHQLLGLALGARTYKMKFGHHGINHPVQDAVSREVLVTSQNHGFAIEAETLRVRGGGDVTGQPVVTHRSLNDGTLEGFAVPELRLRAVQFHPEARGGPHDARHLFDRFLEDLS
jgi:carbamoyl-phosphate synthase small subunit